MRVKQIKFRLRIMIFSLSFSILVCKATANKCGNDSRETIVLPRLNFRFSGERIYREKAIEKH